MTIAFHGHCLFSRPLLALHVFSRFSPVVHFYSHIFHGLSRVFHSRFTLFTAIHGAAAVSKWFPRIEQLSETVANPWRTCGKPAPHPCRTRAQNKAPLRVFRMWVTLLTLLIFVILSVALFITAAVADDAGACGCARVPVCLCVRAWSVRRWKSNKRLSKERGLPWFQAAPLHCQATPEN